MYTVGLQKTWHHPELIVFGLAVESGYEGINAVVADIRNDTPPPVGRRSSFDVGGVRACLIPVLDEYWRYPCDYLLGASHYYRATGSTHELRALQLVWSDTHHRLPWDSGFDPTLAGRQPLLDEPGAFQLEPWQTECDRLSRGDEAG